MRAPTAKQLARMECEVVSRLLDVMAEVTAATDPSPNADATEEIF